MNAWDIYTWEFPGTESHPAVVLGTERRIANKPKVNVLFCSSQRAGRTAGPLEVILDSADGLDRETLCKCDLVFAVPKDQLTRKRGTVTSERRRQIAERVVAGFGLAGL
jgi:mRNA-degrading endonuclease toxin of MazEF toxin-antitoxin module